MMPQYVPVIYLFSEVQISISGKPEYLRDKHRILSLEKLKI